MPHLSGAIMLAGAIIAQTGAPAGQLFENGLQSRIELVRQVREQLDSTESRIVAWGAYNAATLQIKEAIPDLQRLLEAPPVIEPREQDGLRDAMLDALIQLQARLPASLAVKHFQTRPVRSLALLRNANDRVPVLSDLLPKVSGMRWYSIANLLLEDRAPRFAADLLGRVVFRLTVWVVDSNNGSGLSGGGMSSSDRDGIGETPPGYPPHAQYRFALDPRPGFIVLATGPRNVYYSRTVTTSFQYGVSFPDISGPTDADRLAYVLAMPGTNQMRAMRVQTNESIAWSTAEALLNRIAELRGDFDQRYRFLVATLLRAGHLTQSEAASLRLQLDVRIVDGRTDRSVALPSIPR